IADQICAAMVREGLSPEEARGRFYLIDRHGLVLEDAPELMSAQKPYAKSSALGHMNLLNIIQHIKPTILIGTSAQGGSFTQEVIEAMMQGITQRPIIMPLSNPTECSEANPADVLAWTNGKALIATGSPFPNIAQCNNALVFPGIGLGVLAVQAKEVTESMIWAACETLAQSAPVHRDPAGAILPGLNEARHVARKIAHAVAEQACHEGVARVDVINNNIEALIEQTRWEPRYLPFKSL
ncbi:MAG: malic enzyme-like NAD(P)-binding protein, partial [Gammaproteobacteria bacterium]